MLPLRTASAPTNLNYDFIIVEISSNINDPARNFYFFSARPHHPLQLTSSFFYSKIRKIKISEKIPEIYYEFYAYDAFRIHVCDIIYVGEGVMSLMQKTLARNKRHIDRNEVKSKWKKKNLPLNYRT